MRALKLLVAIVENTHGFDESVLQDCLGDMYVVLALSVHPKDIGWQVINRPRLYFVLYLRDRVMCAIDIQAVYQATSERFHGHGLLDIVTAMVSSSAELLACENAVRHRKGLEPVQEPSSSWEAYLSPNQKAYLALYSAKWRMRYGVDPEADSRCSFDLGQNPLFFGGPTRGVPCFCTRSSRLWVPMRRRWLLPSEVGVCMGWPLRDSGLAHFPIALLGKGMHVGKMSEWCLRLRWHACK